MECADLQRAMDTVDVIEFGGDLSEVSRNGFGKYLAPFRQ